MVLDKLAEMPCKLDGHLRCVCLRFCFVSSSSHASFCLQSASYASNRVFASEEGALVTRGGDAAFESTEGKFSSGAEERVRNDSKRRRTRSANSAGLMVHSRYSGVGIYSGVGVDRALAPSSECGKSPERCLFEAGVLRSWTSAWSRMEYIGIFSIFDECSGRFDYVRANVPPCCLLAVLFAVQISSAASGAGCQIRHLCLAVWPSPDVGS